MIIIYFLVYFAYFRAHTILLLCIRACRLFWYISVIFSDFGLFTSPPQPLALSMLPMFLLFIYSYTTKNLGQNSRHRVDISTGDLPNTKQECYELDRRFQCVVIIIVIIIIIIISITMSTIHFLIVLTRWVQFAA
jgi:hypothetical protein